MAVLERVSRVYDSCFNTVNELLAAIMTCEFAFILFLQLADVQTPAHNFKNSSKSHDPSSYRYENIHHLLMNTSPFAPQFRTSSIAFCSLIIISVIIFHYLISKFSSSFEYFKWVRDSLTTYLIDEEMFNEEFTTTMDSFIEDLMISNINFRSSLMNDKNKVNNMDYSTLLAPPPITRRPYVSSRLYGINDNNHSQVPKESLHRVQNVLRNELMYLHSLLSNKCTIWPANRNRIWTDKVKKIWLTFYLIISISIMVFSQIFTIILVIVNKNHIMKYSPGEVNYNTPIKAQFVATIFWCLYLRNNDFTLPVLNMYLTIFDFNKLIIDLEDRILKFKAQTRKFNALKLHLLFISSNHVRDEDSDEEENIEKSLIQSIETLNYKCNVESIDIYLSLRYLLSQFGPIKRNAEILFDSFAAMIIFTLSLILLSTFNHPWSLTEDLLIPHMAVCLVILFNFSFATYAIANSYVKHVIKLTWFKVNLLITEPLRQQQADANKGLDSQDTRFKGALPRNFHTLNSPVISPHMLTIWNRIIQQDQILLARFLTVNVMNTIQLNYSSLLRMNFWLGSVCMIFYNYIVN